MGTAPVLAPTCFPGAVRVSTQLVVRVCEAERHHGRPRGNSGASPTDRPVAMNSFTPVKKQPARLPRPLIQLTPPTSNTPPNQKKKKSPLNPARCFNLPLHGGGELPTSCNNTPSPPAEVAVFSRVCLMTARRPSLRRYTGFSERLITDERRELLSESDEPKTSATPVSVTFETTGLNQEHV